MFSFDALGDSTPGISCLSALSDELESTESGGDAPNEARDPAPVCGPVRDILAGSGSRAMGNATGDRLRVLLADRFCLCSGSRVGSGGGGGGCSCGGWDRTELMRSMSGRLSGMRARLSTSRSSPRSISDRSSYKRLTKTVLYACDDVCDVRWVVPGRRLRAGRTQVLQERKKVVVGSAPAGDGRILVHIRWWQVWPHGHLRRTIDKTFDAARERRWWQRLRHGPHIVLLLMLIIRRSQVMRMV